MNIIQRAIDRWAHPGEFGRQRSQRRYLTALGDHERLTRLLSPKLPEPVVRAQRIANACDSCLHLREQHREPEVRGIHVLSDMQCSMCECRQYRPGPIRVLPARG